MRVIKLGGAFLEKENSLDQFLPILQHSSDPTILIHGGGPKINALLELHQRPVRMHRGQRITPPEDLEIIQMVLSGQVNKMLVAWAHSHQHPSIGLSGIDGPLLRATPIDPIYEKVGDVTEVNIGLFQNLLSLCPLLILSPISLGPDGPLNVNADVAATRVAMALGAETLDFYSDHSGLLDAQGELIESLTSIEARSLLEQGVITGGMIVKIEMILEALRTSVQKVQLGLTQIRR